MKSDKGNSVVAKAEPLRTAEGGQSDDLLPKFSEIAQHRIEQAGPRDRTVSMKFSIGTAQMMVSAETRARNERDEAVACLRGLMVAFSLETDFGVDASSRRIDAKKKARQFLATLDRTGK